MWFKKVKITREPYEYNVNVPFEVAFKALKEGYLIKEGYNFKGWATSPTGPVVYLDKQNVKELRQLVNAEAAQPAAGAGDACVVGGGGMLMLLAGSLRRHGEIVFDHRIFGKQHIGLGYNIS